MLILALALLLWPAPPGALAQETEATVSESDDGNSYGRGFAIFQRYCRSCHGRTGEGDGHVAKYLKVEPSDLTRLTIDNDGEFPTERTLASIDGRMVSVPLHGRDMPIWGAVFQVDEDQTEADVERRLGDVIAYLKGIQVEDEGEE